MGIVNIHGKVINLSYYPLQKNVFANSKLFNFQKNKIELIKKLELILLIKNLGFCYS